MNKSPLLVELVTSTGLHWLGHDARGFFWAPLHHAAEFESKAACRAAVVWARSMLGVLAWRPVPVEEAWAEAERPL